MHFLLLGILLGFGAAIPFGPINLEIARRNLRFGFAYGTITGLGACVADFVYIILISLGILTFLRDPQVMQVIGIAGSLILAWFGVQAFRSNRQPAVAARDEPAPSLLGYGVGGFVITLLNPYTILFWASVSSQIADLAAQDQGILLAGCGVITGTLGWVLFINTLLHFTRHYISEKYIRVLNYSGGFILLGFAAAGLAKAVMFNV